MIEAALRELGPAIALCLIPNEDQLLSATKINPLTWNAVERYEIFPNQSESSYNEQKLAIEICKNTIEDP